ncbi:fimbrial chaperone protein [Pseudomonas sp. JAI115]|uniref:fimbrial biogenesis chaperone n=1 Tax=Pseudomonas sp. JAI115 TaxID=2723061 RepID=UPI00160D39A5|nr:molecular chaperone [Pseudomonas sp. JAI115]MBB6155236.1 fimbrial chaperone protein [Pseudomonas sp. JAI115]
MMTIFYRFSFYAVIVLSMLFTSPAFCSVVLVGTRVIYPASASEKALQFTSQDDYPNLVQIWLDKGNAQSKPETADASFIATPQIFRMNPHSGQLVRLVFTGADLPTDRESVFYLNFVQMPAIKASQASSNLMVMSVTSRVKVFYRPKGLGGSTDELGKALKFKVQGRGAGAKIQVENATPYHAVIREASLLIAGKEVPVASSLMLSPKSTTSWVIPASVPALEARQRLQLTLVNDLGGDDVSEVMLE